MRYSLVAGLTLGIFTLGLPGTRAYANGRFPQSNALFFAPRDPQTLFLRTTFGVIVSHDHGTTWDWICDTTVGLTGVEDPMYAITPNGTILGAAFQGLAISSDNACNFAWAGGALKDQVFIDLTWRPSTPGQVVAFSSAYGGQIDGSVIYKSRLFETVDEGKTFTDLAGTFADDILGETVDVTASDPDRIYVTALRNPGANHKGVFFRSVDHGKSFTESAVDLVGDERAPYIAAVDPTNADRVYVRTSNGAGLPTRLLLSDDAGKTFRVIFHAQGGLAGFALSDDGKRIYIGGPVDGLNVANTSDFQWERRSSIDIGCLKLNKDGLWACSSEKSGFVLGLSGNEGATFEPKLHFCDIRGPLTCAVGSTTHTECTLGGTTASAFPPWPVQRAGLGCSGPVLPDAGGDAASDAGPAPSELDGGGCSMRGPSQAPIATLLAGLAATIALVRRRVRRK